MLYGTIFSFMHQSNGKKTQHKYLKINCLPKIRETLKKFNMKFTNLIQKLPKQNQKMQQLINTWNQDRIWLYQHKLPIKSNLKSIVIFWKLFWDYNMNMKEKASKRRRPPPPNLFAWDSSTSKGGQKPVSVPSNKSKQR